MSKGIEGKIYRKAFSSQWSEKNKVTFQAITCFMSWANHLKVFYSFLWESCIQEGGLQCLGSKPTA